MKTIRIIGWLVLIPALVFWLVAIGGASHSGFFADAYDYEVIVMGGAISTIAALLLNSEAIL